MHLTKKKDFERFGVKLEMSDGLNTNQLPNAHNRPCRASLMVSVRDLEFLFSARRKAIL